jgi:hypothetical protein
MKKYMIADLIKAVESERESDIKAEMDRSGVDENVASYLVDNWRSEADRDQILQVAEDLDADPQDISDNDVENINSAGSTKGTIETSMGIVKYIYDHKALAYTILLLVDGEPLVYKDLEPNIMNEMRAAESFGSYYNDNLRENESYEGCGCKANVCEDTDLAIFSSIS